MTPQSVIFDDQKRSPCSALANNVVPVLVNGRPALMQYRGDEGDMIFTLRLDAAGKTCWIYTLRNPEKLAAALQAVQYIPPAIPIV